MKASPPSIARVVSALVLMLTMAVLYLQTSLPGADKESNWLPMPK